MVNYNTTGKMFQQRSDKACALKKQTNKKNKNKKTGKVQVPLEKWKKIVLNAMF